MSEQSTTAIDAVLLVQMGDGVIREARLNKSQAMQLVHHATAMCGGSLSVSRREIGPIEWRRKDGE